MDSMMIYRAADRPLAHIEGTTNQLGTPMIDAAGTPEDVTELWCQMTVQLADGLGISVDTLLKAVGELDKANRYTKRHRATVARIVKKGGRF